MPLHILKVAAGIGSLEHLRDVVQRYAYQDPELGPIMHMSSRNRPKRADEIVEGGSMFWIIKRTVVARAPIIAIREEERFDGKTGCQFCIRPEIFATVPQPKRGFQGWRYYKDEDTPDDLITGDSDAGKGSPELAQELQELGLL